MTLACLFALKPGSANAQSTATPPTTDSSAQASPLGPTLKTPATDDSAQASPSPSDSHTGISIPAHTALRVVLTEGIDSGNLKNGQTVHAKLAADTPLTKHSSLRGKHAMLRAGAPALLTVVGTVPAGKINAVGEISLELLHVENIAVETDILTFRGQPGHRDLPDSAPEVGTNAGLHAGMPLTFHVQPPPDFDGFTHASKVSPGSVTAVVSGSKSAPNAGQIANRGTNQTIGSPGDAAPNQHALPQSPTGTAQPH